MEKYKINFAMETITITRDFAKKANDPDSNEYNFLQKIKTDYPNMRVVHNKHRRPKRGNANKGLSYKNMERYINTFDNAADLKKVFSLVRERSAPQKNKFSYVKTWFLAQFPDYCEFPPLVETNNTIPILPLEDILPKEDTSKLKNAA